ncbi:MAG: hypothetical protein R3F54_13980 [Alphaproteobacteria bacterium]
MAGRTAGRQPSRHVLDRREDGAPIQAVTGTAAMALLTLGRVKDRERRR